MISQWGLQGEYYLQANFDHLPILQDDEGMKASAQKTKAETIKTIVDLGVTLTPEEIRNLLNI
jgi:hypothetical protein